MEKRTIAISVLIAGLFALALSFSLSTKHTTRTLHAVTIGDKGLIPSLGHTGTTISAHPYSISSFSLPGVFTIQTHLPSCFLFAVFTDTGADEVDQYTENISLRPSVFFQIIFTLIISPNAP